MARWLAVVLASGCGGASVCERSFCGDRPTEADVAVCEDAMKGCSGTERRAIDRFLSCVERASGCVDGAACAEDPGPALASCDDELASVGTDCGGAALVTGHR